MQRDSTREGQLPQDPVTAIKNGTCVLSGFGLKVTVDGQHLLCADGFGDERREIRLARATCGLKRLVIIGHTGFITFDALRWLEKLGAGVSAVDTDGNVIMTSAPTGANYPHLRRSQALARDCDIGIDITRTILKAKVSGQAAVLRTIVQNESPTLSEQILVLDAAEEYDQMRWTEGQAAAIYWRQWERVSLNFSRQDAKRVPEHWFTFRTRSSPISGSPRKAANPANALLNYLYAVLETETVIACHTVGLDPGIGIMHHDQPSRNSLALDIMEAVRPQVDEWFLRFFGKQVFRKQDFSEDDSNGCVRIAYDIRKMLVETAQEWARAVGPWVGM